MDAYYQPDDLPKFPEIAKEAPELAAKFVEQLRRLPRGSTEQGT